jgi:alpha-D-ribose 1-methylphosphonate 5-triphosphate synthase subunit PhnH
MPALAQADFRALLAALSRPGTLERIAPPADAPAALAAAAGLADVEVPLCVLAAPGDEHWAQALHLATSAPAAEPAWARIVVALRPPSEEEIAALPRGDALHPEHGARLIIAVGGLAAVPPARASSAPKAQGERGHTVLALSGPGVPGTRRIEVTGPSPGVFRALAAVNTAFPAGVDAFLVAGDGTVAGLPRSAHITIDDDITIDGGEG